ncbi:hypothetical protein PHLGIDRAFT_137581 [Phlebiopsis gigantea 11061_1 CR5-6]|uniref:Uncharacterized protein n=1 Tax=Phlebiopsis gigantea (strain 11061_1 CR5-6) TaxID=745531 RepID=A0A0C3PXJ5_PHLG1|nr:hypothetical protein PHLGIDRAFT_137581 [Phlebiopsis gigantea 11061_1 CR5-6]
MGRRTCIAGVLGPSCSSLLFVACFAFEVKINLRSPGRPHPSGKTREVLYGHSVGVDMNLGGTLGVAAWAGDRTPSRVARHNGSRMDVDVPIGKVLKTHD